MNPNMRADPAAPRACEGEKSALFRAAYALLARSTPLAADCGELCGSRCCRGDEDAGMILLPGEAAFLGGQTFLRVSEVVSGGRKLDFASCDGSCRRPFRPIACRIYPFAPYVGKEGGLSVVVDPRVKYICPLAQSSGSILPSFRQNVRKALFLLDRDPDIHDHFLWLSSALDDYARFTG